MIEEARAVPGVQRAGAATNIPLLNAGPDSGTQIEGKPFTPGQALSPFVRLVTDEYVEAMGMPLKRGRTFRASDTAPGAPPVVMINEQLARQAWPGEDAIGKRLSAWTRGTEPEWREVVGVVGDVRSLGADTPPRAELFMPYTQPPLSAWNVFQRSMALVVRTAADPAAHLSTLRGAVRAVDASLPLYDVMTMDEALGADGAGSRFNTWLLSMLAAAGLVLAALGIYGVLAYFVTQRTAEIGLRLALGATPGTVLMMVVRRGAVLALAGITIGLVAALAATRMITTLLFEITPTDLPTYLAGGIGLMMVALLACLVPALRAVRISPTRSLAES
jgi:predicted permease